MKLKKGIAAVLAVLYIALNAFTAYSSNGLPSNERQLYHKENQIIGPGENLNPVNLQQGVWVDLKLLEEKQKEQHSITIDQEHNYIIILGAVTEEEYSKFLSHLAKIDFNLINRFKQDNWKIVLTNADLDYLLLRGMPYGVKGYISFDHKTIYVNSGEYSYCIIHEMGHFLDYSSGFASFKKEFQEIFETESINLTQYGKTHPVEFFAEVYMYGKIKKDELTAACPAALNYLNDYLNRLQ